MKLFLNKVGNYFFLKLMSCTSTSESESETKKKLIKIGKHVMYNSNI